MTGWDDLSRELGAWAAEGRIATFWWRDDDAGRPSSGLERLVALAMRHRVPVALAVVPGEAEAALADLLASAPADIDVLQHGLDHRNHAPAGEKKSEFGSHRPVHDMLADVAIGWERLRATFTRRPPHPVFVPPWNRIAPALIPRLGNVGLRGLSTFGPRAGPWAAAAIAQANTHVDIVDWHGTRRFIGEAAALRTLVEHLAARRRGMADPAEPTGLLTHHIEHDEACWGFVDRLLTEAGGTGRARWLSVHEIFTLPP